MTSGKSPISSGELLKLLASSDSPTVIKTLKKLEIAGNINDLPEIVRVMSELTNPKLLAEFSLFLSKVKSKQAPALMAQFISDPAFTKIRTELVRACWESNLDYSAHLMLFARIFIAGDYLLALEAFTVIENTCLERPVSKSELTEISIVIMNSLPDQPEAKQRLARELIQILEPFVTEG